MAGIRNTRIALLVGTALAGPVILSRTALTGAVSYPGPLRITRTGLTGAVAYPGPLRISQTQGFAVINYRSFMRITYFAGLRVQNLNRVFYLGRLNSTSRINDFTLDNWELELVAGPIPEFNPYKPQVPESLLDIEDGGREIFDWLEEQQKTIRLQHNITQAGDTTFPHQLIINTHTDKHYTLGSIGKFYHEDYGMILARYVQFEKMNLDLPGTAPVGLIRKSKNLEWIVTNRLELSSPYLCVGIGAAYTTPTDGSYGWVTIDGANLQPIINESESAANGEAFVWSSSGAVSNDGEGVIIARRTDESTEPTLLKGRAWIRLESLSRGAIVVALDEYIQAIAQLQEDVQQLQELTGINGELASLQSQLTVLSNRLLAEENARRQADTAINNRISNLNFVTEAQLNAAINGVETTLASVAAGLQNQINATNAIAVEALQKANQALAFDPSFILEQISLILAMFEAETLRPKGKFPLVNGAVPPELMYLDDGTLLYTETY